MAYPKNFIVRPNFISVRVIVMVRVWRPLCAFLLPGLVAAKLVREEITLTWDLGAPNGHVREMIKMNDDFPGPHFSWDEDDDIEVNKIKQQSTVRGSDLNVRK